MVSLIMKGVGWDVLYWNNGNHWDDFWLRIAGCPLLYMLYKKHIQHIRLVKRINMSLKCIWTSLTTSQIAWQTKTPEQGLSLSLYLSLHRLVSLVGKWWKSNHCSSSGRIGAAHRVEPWPLNMASWEIPELNGDFHKWSYPKWMVYNGKSHENRWFGGVPTLGNL